MKTIIKRQDGFTLVELMMAMAIFSFMLMIITSGIIRVMHSYEAGAVSRATQQNVRLAVDDFSKAVRASAKAVVPGGDPSRVCLLRGSQMVEYALDGGGNLRRALLPTDQSCSAPTFSAIWSTLNDPAVVVTQFVPTMTNPVGTGLGTVSVELTAVSAGDLNDLDSSRTKCLDNGTGSQFCSATSIKTTAALSGEGK
jgi:prepilin-type N-terminal cleavage/methylation domain-containing protein